MEKKKLHRYKKRDYYDLYPKDLYGKLEFDKVLEIVDAHCQSSLGKELLHRVKFQTDIKQIDKLLQQVLEFKQMFEREEDHLPERIFLNLKNELSILKVEGTVLTEEQVFRIFQVLVAIQEIVWYFEKNEAENAESLPQLFELTQKVEVDKGLLNQIKMVLNDEGRIKNSASKALNSIRKLIIAKYQELDSKFKAVMRAYKTQNLLTDDLESVRNGRRVLAVPSTHKRKINGIIVDESASGKICFMEPAETIQINNDIFALQQEEKREIYRILKELSTALRPYHNHITAYQQLMAQFDYIRAKAKFAIEIDATKPILVPERTIDVLDAYHPLLLYMNKKAKKQTVPLTLRLSNAGRILVISGPNAGGKSVSLKAVGLLQLMLQTGMLLPVDETSQMGIFNKIMVDIGDEQSLENDLSTYSSHLKNMKYFTDFADAKTLILIDEFGSGTDPKFGGAIAEAVLEKLTKKFVFGVITTHYSNIKIFATNTSGILNGTLLFDIKNLQPKYQLVIGRPGSSFAFEIAQKIGIDNEILDAAKEKVGEDYKDFDYLLSTLHSEKLELETKTTEIAAKERRVNLLLEEYTNKTKEINKNKKKIILETKKEALQATTAHKQKLEKMLQNFNKEKEDKRALQNIKQAIEQDKKAHINEIEALRDVVFEKKHVGKLVIGAAVQLREGSQTGTLVEIRKKDALVEFGLLKTRVKLKELVVVNQPEKQNKTNVKFDTVKATMDFTNTLDVRGKRRDEALQEVEDLLDQALIVSADYLKIIHGKGDGILRRSIREYLKKYDAVQSIKDEEPEYGGEGISIIELV